MGIGAEHRAAEAQQSVIMSPPLKDRIALLLVAAISGGVMVTVWAVTRLNERNKHCLSNLKQISLAFAMYAQDYNDRFPPSQRWIDSNGPYYHEHPGEEPLFTCPSVNESSGYGYAYNSKVSGVDHTRITVPEQTVLVYETTNLVKNASGNGQEIAYRHKGGAYFAFGDFHVKWFSQTARPSFEVKLSAQRSQSK